jgi:hypothetical protein
VHNDRADDIATTESIEVFEATPPDPAARLTGLLALFALLPVCLIFFTLARDSARQQPPSVAFVTVPSLPISPRTLTYSWDGPTGSALTVRGIGFAPGEAVTIHAAPAIEASASTWLPVATPQAAADGSISVNGVELGPQLDQISGWQLIARGNSSGYLATAGPLEVPPTPTPMPTFTPQPTFTPTPTTAPTDTPQPIMVFGGPAAPTLTPTPATSSATLSLDAFEYPRNMWLAAYFDNRDFFGSPYTQTEAAPLVNYWGSTPPVPGLQINNFSAQFTGEFYFDQTQTLLLNLIVEGGARVYFDGALVIDQWQIGKLRRAVGSVAVQAGWHRIRIVYYNTKHSATLCLNWELGLFTAWQGRYYNNPSLEVPPVIIRNDDQINFDWGYNPPDPRVNPDNFSVDWVRYVNFPASGDYKFTLTADDSAKVFIDGREMTDLTLAAPGTKEFVRRMSRGKHLIEVQYVELSWSASIHFTWEYILVVPTRNPPNLCPGGYGC